MLRLLRLGSAVQLERFLAILCVAGTASAIICNITRDLRKSTFRFAVTPLQGQTLASQADAVAGVVEGSRVSTLLNGSTWLGWAAYQASQKGRVRRQCWITLLPHLRAWACICSAQLHTHAGNKQLQCTAMQPISNRQLHCTAAQVGDKCLHCIVHCEQATSISKATLLQLLTYARSLNPVALHSF